MEKNTETKKKFIIRQSIQYVPREKSGPILKRIITSLEKGGLKGNLFMMIMTTTGCTFTLLPYYAKLCGLLVICFLLLFPAIISYVSSMLIYYGFKATNAKDYGECMKEIMGLRMGFLSNIVIFLHTFGAVICCWMFSFFFLNTTILKYTNFQTVEEAENFSQTFMTIYFYSVAILIFIVSTIGQICFLKKLSSIGIIVMFYLAFVMLMEMPQFYDYYNKLEPIHILWYKFDLNIFKAWGVTNFLFLNQYTVIPICNGMRRLCNKRLSKVVSKTIILSMVIYLMFLFIGFFSLPDDITKCPYSFLQRKELPGSRDYLLSIGNVLFAFTLLLGVLVKGHFFILSFHQVLDNTIFFFRSKLFPKAVEEEETKKVNKIRKTLVVEKVFESDKNQENMNDKKDDSSNNNIVEEVDNPNKINLFTVKEESSTEFEVYESYDEADKDELDEEHKKESKEEVTSTTNNEDLENQPKISNKEEDEMKEEKIKKVLHEITKESRFQVITEDLNHKESVVEKIERRSKRKIFINLIFLLLITNLALILQKKLKEFVSLLGNIVGIFEIAIIPFIMIYILNKDNNIISSLKLKAFGFSGLIFVIFSIVACYVTIAYPDHH